LSASVAVTVPLATPVTGSGLPIVAVAVGAVFFGLMVTVTGTARLPP
jgi:hypothetical protein